MINDVYLSNEVNTDKDIDISDEVLDIFWDIFDRLLILNEEDFEKMYLKKMMDKGYNREGK